MRLRTRPTVRGRIGLAALLLFPACGKGPEPLPGLSAGGERAAARADAGHDGVELPIPAPVAGDPAKAALHLERARTAHASGDAAHARRELDAALAVDPACAEALERLGWQLLEPGSDQDDGAALVCFTKLEKLGVDTSSVKAGAGLARAFGGDAAGARSRIEAAIETQDLAADPARLVRLHLELGRLRAAAGELEAAERSFLRALELERIPMRRAEPLALLGALLAEHGRLEEAERRLREAIAADPEHVQARFLFARLLARLGRCEDAQREARIHDLLSRLHDRAEGPGRPDLETKVRLGRELMALDPDCGSFEIAFVRTLLKARRYAEAQEEITAIAKRRGTTSGLAFLLARAHAGQGDLAGAEKARATMLQLDPQVPASLDREIVEEWRRGHPDVSDDTLELLLARWGRR
jgi:tetratricopeptide (TPR) repeat protein